MFDAAEKVTEIERRIGVYTRVIAELEDQLRPDDSAIVELRRCLAVAHLELRYWAEKRDGAARPDATSSR